MAGKLRPEQYTEADETRQLPTGVNVDAWVAQAGRENGDDGHTRVFAEPKTLAVDSKQATPQGS